MNWERHFALFLFILLIYIKKMSLNLFITQAVTYIIFFWFKVTWWHFCHTSNRSIAKCSTWNRRKYISIITWYTVIVYTAWLFKLYFIHRLLTGSIKHLSIDCLFCLLFCSISQLIFCMILIGGFLKASSLAWYRILTKQIVQ